MPVPKSTSPAGFSRLFSGGTDQIEIQFQKILLDAPGIFLILSGFPEMIVEFVNEPLLRSWGRSRDIIGRPLLEVLPEISDQAFPGLLRKVFETGKVHFGNEEKAIVVKSGRPTDVYYNYVYQPIFNHENKVTAVMVMANDVTEQVSARKKREEGQAALEMFIRQAPVGMVVYRGPEFVVEVANEKMLEMWGKHLDEVKGKSVLEIFPEINTKEDLRALHQLSIEKFEKGESYVVNEQQITFQRKGEPYTGWFSYTHEPLRDADGRVEGIMAIASEVTDQVNTRRKIEENEKQLKHITDALPSLIAYINEKEEYLFNNKSYGQWFGHSASSVIGKTVREVIGAEAYRHVGPYIKEALSGNVVNYEAWVPYQEAGERYISATYIPQLDQSGQVIGFYALVNDVTDRLHTEASIKANEERLRLAIEATDAGTFDLNLQTGELYWSDQMKRICGFSPDESITLDKAYSVSHPEDIKAFQEALDLSRDPAGKGELEMESRVIRNNDGQTRWLYTRSKVFFDEETGERKPVRLAGVAIDITGRKKTERALIDSENRFRTMANEAPLFVWETDHKLQTTFLNKTGRRYFGIDEQQDLQMLSWKKYIHPEDIDRLLEVMETAKEKDESYKLEIRLRNESSGLYRWFLDQGSPRFGNDGFMGFIGTSLDIHDQKENEEDLERKVRARTRELDEQNRLMQKQNDLIKKILDSSLDLIAVYDRETRVVTINNASLQFLGLKEEEVIGKKITDVVPQMRDGKGHMDLLRALEGETVHNTIYHSPVTGRYYENFLAPLRDENDQVYGALVVGHDNTELVQSAQTLKNKNEELENYKSFLEQLIDSSVEYISVLDRELKYITINKKQEELFGRSREQLKGHDVLETSPQLRGTQQLDCILKALEGKESYLHMRPSVTRPGFYEDSYFIPLVIHEKIEGVIVMARDVTDIVRSEKLLHQKNLELQHSLDQLRSQELKDVQKNNFIAMASHELKTPITSIKGYVQLLLNAFTKEKEENRAVSPLLVRSSLISVDKQVARLTRIISELLDLSKIETGTLELRRETFSLNELAIETVEDILYTNNSHKINLYHDFHARVNADKDRIGQVMINFLTNAIKYSPGSDKIDVSIVSLQDGEVAFQVRDYGIGIDKSEQKKIFERFYRARGKEEQTYPGFGIGLFIANEFVQKHGGRLLVESDKGNGSIFTFTLPINN